VHPKAPARCVCVCKCGSAAEAGCSGRLHEEKRVPTKINVFDQSDALSQFSFFFVLPVTILFCRTRAACVPAQPGVWRASGPPAGGDTGAGGFCQCVVESGSDKFKCSRPIRRSLNSVFFWFSLVYYLVGDEVKSTRSDWVPGASSLLEVSTAIMRQVVLSINVCDLLQ
jgi:hypothetical protein